MFGQTFVETNPRTRLGWTMTASVGIQISLVLTAMLIQIVNPELLPRTAMNYVLQLAPPPPPPGPKPPIAVRAENVVRRLLNGTTLLMPLHIPERLATIVDPPAEPVEYAGVEGGVEGGIPGGTHGGVPGSVLSQTPRPAPPPEPVVKEPPKQRLTRIAVGGVVQEAMILNKVTPVYPAIARQARVSGKVIFTAVIGRDGTIQNLTLVGGHPMLVRAATEAVRQWRYRPTMLNGEPVEVVTEIVATFILN